MFKVSIIVPIYQVEEYITECLQSVVSQSIGGTIECIMIDDCGRDSSMNIAEQFVESYANEVSDLNNKITFKLLKQERNQGPSAARNRGIQEAQGEYLFFLDADDTITPNCIEDLYVLAKQYDSDYVQGLYEHDNGNNYFVTRNLPELLDDEVVIKKTMLNASAIHFTPHNKLVRREFIIKHKLFFPLGIIHEDSYWLYFMSKHLKKMVICHRLTYYLRSNPHSLVHTENFELEVRSYKKLIEDCSRNIDAMLPGEQKEFIINDLLIAIDKRYYHNNKERMYLIDCVKLTNICCENALLDIVLRMSNGMLRTKLLHLLLRILKRNDKKE